MARLICKLTVGGHTTSVAVDLPPDDVEPVRLHEAAQAASQALRRPTATRLGADTRERPTARRQRLDPDAT
jgi:hypothetical protein